MVLLSLVRNTLNARCCRMVFNVISNKYFWSYKNKVSPSKFAVKQMTTNWFDYNKIILFYQSLNIHVFISPKIRQHMCLCAVDIFECTRHFSTT